MYAELEQRGAKTEECSTVGSEPIDVIPCTINVADNSALEPDRVVGSADTYRTVLVADSMSDLSKTMFVTESTESLEDVIIKDEHVNTRDGNALINSSGIDSDEIVQIPLDENEVLETSDIETAQNEDETNVPLLDAPLIGAPFRLISFFARYVSGADLVNKNSGS